MRQRLPADERRIQLMDAAIRLLARDGFRRTTADAVVAEAHASKGQIWRLFDDFTDLLHQSGRHALQQITAGLAAELDLDAPVPDVLRSAIAVAARVPQRWPDQHRAIQQLVVNLRDADGVPIASRDDFSDVREGQERLLRRGQVDGDIRSDIDPRALAVTYQAAVDAMIARLEEDASLDPDRCARELADLLIDGMGG